jgi:hypothetical protein
MQKISKIFLIKNILILCLLAACAEAASNWQNKSIMPDSTVISDANNEKGGITVNMRPVTQDSGPKYDSEITWERSHVFWAKMLSPTHVMTIYHQYQKKALIVHHWKINLDDNKKVFTVASWFSMESDLLDREPVQGNRNTLACVKNRCG